jgi:hypothetical protein
LDTSRISNTGLTTTAPPLRGENDSWKPVTPLAAVNRTTRALLPLPGHLASPRFRTVDLILLDPEWGMEDAEMAQKVQPGIP